MSKRIGIEVSVAVAEAVALANVDVIAAYPITPQTHIVEHLADLVAEGKVVAEYIAVESEHSAISACLGSSCAGARSFTATASQGLALMHEILFIASSLRLPIVMAVANRALSAPINIWVDHSDIMPQRDTGWIQLFAQNGQEAFDLTLQAFRLAEDLRVLLPVMINLDGFSLSHVIEPVVVLDQSEVNAFLPSVSFLRRLDPRHPRTIGSFGAQDVYTEVKQQQDMALLQAKDVLSQIWLEFQDRFGRSYEAVESYRTDDADIVIVTMGAVGETAKTAVDEMRTEGIRAGLAAIRLWRPFPSKEFLDAVKEARVLAVLDRMLSPGSQGGPIALELRSAFYHASRRPTILDFIAGLGGREISRRTFKQMVARSLKDDPQARNYTLLDVRLS